MDLLSAMEELASRPSTTGFPCSVGTFLQQIKDEERASFNKILENNKIGSVSIFDMLKNNGYKVAKASVYKHRRKLCRCFE
jgi:hypothetical protein